MRTRISHKLKPFYMMAGVNDDGKTVRAMDGLVPKVGEVIGGSQREKRLDVLESRMAEQHLHPSNYGWNCDLLAASLPSRTRGSVWNLSGRCSSAPAWRTSAM